MCLECDLFDSYQPLQPPQLIGLGDGRTVPAIGAGDVRLLVYIGDGRRRVLTLHDVYHVPVLDKNFLSVLCLARHNLQIIFSAQSCQITDGQETVRTAYKRTLYTYLPWHDTPMRGPTPGRYLRNLKIRDPCTQHT